MLCNDQSSYPDKIDEMTFFQDTSLHTIEYMKKYQNLISAGKYSDANYYINGKTGIYGYFACFFNMLENRIYALQDDLLNQPGDTHNDFSHYTHETLGLYHHDALAALPSEKTKFNPITNQSEIPDHAIAGMTVWTGGKYKNE